MEKNKPSVLIVDEKKYSSFMSELAGEWLQAVDILAIRAEGGYSVLSSPAVGVKPGFLTPEQFNKLIESECTGMAAAFN